MQMIAQQLSPAANRSLKTPRWLKWMRHGRAQEVKTIPTEDGNSLSVQGICPNLHHVSHVSWAPDQTHVSFVGNGRYVWLLSSEGKHTELLAMLPDAANQSLTNAWAEDSHAFHFSYMKDNQLVDCEFDLEKRKLNIKEVV